MTSIEVRTLVEVLDPPPGRLVWYRATLQQGWKRQLRRMFAATGTPIARLARVRIGTVRLATLRPGAVRPLSAAEVRSLGAGRVAAGGVAPSR
jgi:pseudouridine synthase